MEEFEGKLKSLVEAALEEDLGDGDFYSNCCIEEQARGKAVLRIKEDGILAGLAVAEKIFSWKESGSGFSAFKRDGEKMQSGEVAFEIEASVRTILACERLVLNCMQRMSGIATLTRQYCERIRGCRSRILDTRKTTPNFRLLEKEAVRIGGGMNHRFGLYDMIMLKDNHIDYCGGIEKAIEKAIKYVQNSKRPLKIEVETRNLSEVKKAVEIGRIDRIMLDNFSPPEILKALEIIAGRTETEASGGINLENIREFAETGVDYISIGALIHQARSLDLSLKAY